MKKDNEVISNYVVTAERMIADDSFQYKGDSIYIIDIVNAIKQGAVLIDTKQMQKAFRELKDFCSKWKKFSSPKECRLLVEALEENLYNSMGISDEATINALLNSTKGGS